MHLLPGIILRFMFSTANLNTSHIHYQASNVSVHEQDCATLQPTGSSLMLAESTWTEIRQEDPLFTSYSLRSTCTAVQKVLFS